MDGNCDMFKACFIFCVFILHIVIYELSINLEKMAEIMSLASFPLFCSRKSSDAIVSMQYIFFLGIQIFVISSYGPLGKDNYKSPNSTMSTYKMHSVNRQVAVEGYPFRLHFQDI